MKDPQHYESLTQEEIDGFKDEILKITKSLTKAQVISVKSMILPPMFTFNVLKVVMMIQNPKKGSEITWNLIKKELLASVEVTKRRCEGMKMQDFEEEDVSNLEQAFQQVFTPLGQNIEAKSELYGPFVHKMCRMCLSARAVLHGSKFVRNQD